MEGTSLLVGLGIVLGAVVVGGVVARLLHRRRNQTERVFAIGRQLDLDLPRLLDAAGALVTFLIVLAASSYRHWPPESSILLMASVGVAAAVLVTLMALAVGSGTMVSVITGLVAGALLFSMRFNYLEQWFEPLDRIALTFGEYRITLWGVLSATIALIVLYGIARFVFRLTRVAVRANDRWDTGQQLLVEKLLGIGIAAVTLMLAIDLAGLDTTMLSVFSGTLGLGIGFGLKSIFSNLVSGLLLLMDRSITPGDTIAVDDTVGEVQQVGVRAVSVRTRDNKVFLIPNETLVTDTVENWGYRSKQVREHLAVDVAYDSDLDLVERLLLGAAAATDRVLTEPAPVVRITDLVGTGIRNELRFWITTPRRAGPT